MFTTVGRACEKTLERIDDALVMLGRALEEQELTSSTGITGSHRVKPAEAGGFHGFDRGKKIESPEWHVVTDTLGHLLDDDARAAVIQDRDKVISATERVGVPYRWFRIL